MHLLFQDYSYIYLNVRLEALEPKQFYDWMQEQLRGIKCYWNIAIILLLTLVVDSHVGCHP